MTADDDLTSKAGTLADSVQTLVAAVGTLRASNVKLAARGHWNRVLIIVTILGLVLDLALSGLFIAQHVAQNRINDRINCNNDLRSATSKIADLDRTNVDHFFAAVVHVKTAAEFQLAYKRYLAVRIADDNARNRLGQGDAGTCG